MSYEAKLAKARELIGKRDEIDAQLDAMFGGEAPARRGRPPRKEMQGGGSQDSDAAGVAAETTE